MGEEDDYYCETCDRNFYSFDDLVDHDMEHQVCGIDGCTFEAHIKVISKHIEMQHATGLFERMQVGNTPEDITKWREERKKNFPTKENIENRQKQQEEMIKRGERLGLKKPKRFGERNREDLKSNTKTKKTRPQKKKKLNLPEMESDDDDDTLKYNGNIPPFRGTKELYATNLEENESDDYDIDDSEWDVKVSIPNVTPTQSSLLFNNSLGNLMSAYISSDEEVNDSELNLSSSSNVVPTSNSNSVSKPVSDDELPEEVKIERPLPDSDNVTPETNNHQELNPPNQVQRKPKKLTNLKNSKQLKVNNSKKVHSFKRKRSTLLEKLLANEILRERNLILQCVKFVVDNNFLQ